MSSQVSAQHPAVVLRSSYQLVRTLLVIATIAVVGLALAVVVLAINISSTSASSPARATPKVITSAPVVQPNPDDQGLTASPSAGSSSNYPGHY